MTRTSIFASISFIRLTTIVLGSALIASFHLAPRLATSSAAGPSPQATQTPFRPTPASIPGTIQCEDFDNGGEGVAYHDLEAANWGGEYRTTGVDIQECREGGFQICCTYSSEWIEYTVNVTATGTYSIDVRAASDGPGGLFHVEIDGTDVTGPMSVPDSGGWEIFKTVTRDGINLTAGQHVMRLSMDGEGNQTSEIPAVGNFNHIRILPSSVDTTPETIGRWSAPANWPSIAIHTMVLPNGKVLFWSNDQNAEGRDVVGSSQAKLWDPETDTFTPVPNLTTNLFCSGHSFLPDGRLLVTGGHAGRTAVGVPDTNIFDFRTNTWTRVQDMNDARWYPTNCTLGNGEVLVLSGTIDGERGVNTLPQVWQTTGGWRSLTSAINDIQVLYPWLVLAPNGTVFNAGPDYPTSFLDTSGTGSWSEGPASNYGFRDSGSAVIYDEGKVLIAGGGTPTNTAETINLNERNPTWRYVSSMAFARRQLTLTVLPDGKVLATGGTSGGGVNNAVGSVLAAELWDPVTERWTTLASMQVRRLYHSTAALLPDGRVISAGGGLPAGTNGDFNHPDAEIYSPPYLFRGARPQITSAPASISYGQKFQVVTPERKSIANVTLIRIPAVTHSFNMDQRFIRLKFSRKGQGLNVTAPSNRNLCPPGHYMLFILNGNGVPSVAKIISIN